MKLNDTELIKIMANKTKIVDHLQSSYTNDLEKLCSDISKIQRLTKTSSVSGNCGERKDKEVQLTSMDFKETCGHCKKKGHKQKDCPK